MRIILLPFMVSVGQKFGRDGLSFLYNIWGLSWEDLEFGSDSTAGVQKYLEMSGVTWLMLAVG